MILDTSEDESIALQHLWLVLEESKHSEQYQQLSIIPSFIAEHEYDESNLIILGPQISSRKRTKHMVDSRPYSMSMGDDGAIGLGLDPRQRLPSTNRLNLASGKKFLLFQFQLIIAHQPTNFQFIMTDYPVNQVIKISTRMNIFLDSKTYGFG